MSIKTEVENFYISYSDMITLLLIFFVYLFSISEIDPVKLMKAAQSMKKELSGNQDEMVANSTSKMLEARIKLLESQIKETTSTYDKEKLEERKAKLQGGIAVIQVGAPSEVEMKKRKQLFQDALSSTKAALDEGVVAGAGMCLYTAQHHLKNTLEHD